MKYLALIIFSTVSLIDPDASCFDHAVDQLLKTEILRGSPMNDEEAFQYLNWTQSICEAQR